jgi:hypothetical protein
MGMFNDRCMVTGACLYDVTAILLREQDDGSFRPCSLPVEATWDNYGSVEVRQEPNHLRHLAKGLVSAFQSGQLLVNFEACYREAFVASDNAGTIFGKTVAAAEMDSIDSGRNVQLSGARFRVAMIATPVARALASTGAIAQVLEPMRTLDWEGGAALLYRGHDNLVHDHDLQALVRLQAALDHRGIKWTSSGTSTTQFSREEERLALQEALKRFMEDLPVRKGLLQYAHQEYCGDLTIEDILGREWFEWE